MSGAGENRTAWRRQSQQANRQNQDARSGNSTPTREGGRQQAMNALSGNAWTAGKGKTSGGGGGDRGAPQAAPVQAERHVPVKNYNAAEVKDFLKKKYLESIGDHQGVHQKVEGDSVTKRSSGAWGNRGNMPHLMPSGQDFFTQLKKQLAALEQTDQTKK